MWGQVGRSCLSVKQANTNRTRARFDPASVAEARASSAARLARKAGITGAAQIPQPALRKRRRLAQHPQPDGTSGLGFMWGSPEKRLMSFCCKKSILVTLSEAKGL